ncbi:MAG: FKBP-type peptidyl-prolyl cis-trans isomerase [Lysobacteraceae bacterium]|nr:MAG: FKBP-type peptidyl-prolyl cis-trans isomerase [Xanthomonadaceae bacterium]
MSPTRPVRKLTLLFTALSLAMVLPLAACKPLDKDGQKAEDKAGESGKGEPASKIAGLPTEKQQVSYMIGMDIGKSLKPIKDEVDMATVNRAINDMFADKKPLMTDEQMMQVAQAFSTKMQAKQKAEMEAKAKKNLAEGDTFLAANTKKEGVVTTASGLQYQVVKMGSGPKPTGSDSVKVLYTGKLLDGTKFDSTEDRGNEPAQFVVNGVVPGWTEALQLMPVGSKFKLWIPAKLGYGEAGTPGGPIPPNATLAFEVELVEIVKQ